MDTQKYLRKRISIVFWALLLIWWGVRWSILVALPEGSGLLGTGILLLGANAVLKLTGFAPKAENTFFGLLTFLSGSALIFIKIFHLSINLPVFETILVVSGVVLLIFALAGKHRISSQES